MKKLVVNGSTSYNILIESGLISRSGEIMREHLDGRKVMIVSDSKVASLYLARVAQSVRSAGYELFDITVASGEDSKSLDNYSFLINTLSKFEFASTDIIVALGGGVVGDLVGFVAATYKRGLKFVQMPTSLLACVDSSVGGKNAINLETGKNQVGTIRNPSIVICDPDTILSLDKNSLMDGYAEIIKYAILRGKFVIDSLRECIRNENYADIIQISLDIKRDIVEMDESDSSIRQFLNFGHMIGHALEVYSDYSISHGNAVAIGMAIETKAAALSGYTLLSVYSDIASLISEFGFETECDCHINDLILYIHNDKRIRNGNFNLIIPKQIGECVMREISEGNIYDYFYPAL